MGSWVPPSLMVISRTAAAIGWTIPHAILFPFRPRYGRLAEPYHMVPHESSAAPKHRIWVIIVSFLNTIQMPICHVGCLRIANTWIYISPYTSGILLSWKRKNQFVFFRINLWPSPFWVFKVRNMLHNPSKDAADWSVVADFKSLLNFKVNFLKIWFSQTRCPTLGAGHSMATSRIVRNHPCEYSDRRQRIQKLISKMWFHSLVMSD